MKEREWLKIKTNNIAITASYELKKTSKYKKLYE
jgi:hypothetical protein